MTWHLESAREQAPLPTTPYDWWRDLDGDVNAEFHRLPSGFLVRFIDEADFEIASPDLTVTGRPVPGKTPQALARLYTNGIAPMLGNHKGGLFLHGSAALVNGKAVAFLAPSRSGKTTLAGAFAKAGHPFLTEDVIELKLAGETYILQPDPSNLRLFLDSAEQLLGHEIEADDPDLKVDLMIENELPSSDRPADLARIFILGSDQEAPLSISQLAPQEALSALLPHSFILDVEDKARLKSHFGRLAKLAARLGCWALDYTREYEELPAVVDAIVQNLRERRD